MRITVGFKIISGFVLALVLLFIIGVTSYKSFSEYGQNVALIEESSDLIVQLEVLISQMTNAESMERGYIVAGQDTYLTRYSETVITVNSQLELIKKLAKNDVLTESKYAELEALVNRKMGIVESIVETGRNNSLQEAQELMQQNTGKVVMDNIRSLANEIEKEAVLDVKKHELATDLSAKSSMYIIVIGIPIAFIVLSVSGYYITRSIVNPLQKATVIAEQIAAGDLEVKMDGKNRSDEIGTLMKTFREMVNSLRQSAENAKQIAIGNLAIEILPKSEKDVMGNAQLMMIESLRETAAVANQIAKGDTSVLVKIKSDKDIMTIALNAMIESLRQIAAVTESIAKGDLRMEVVPKSQSDRMGNALAVMVDFLRTMSTELTEGVNILSEASGEIMASTSQVASGASETASAISETTTSVEEVKNSAQMANERALSVSNTTQNTVQVSESGLKAVEKSIESMNHIQVQVQSIAQSLVSLSEQSQSIGEIIATVNDLAEQSNLLAVNAAIEAAKAGEQGKGFAVVAQEVKILAEQSKEATSQVRAILNDILKATNSAVMATEQGSKAVESGVNLSKEAGKTIRLMAEHVENAAKSALQITATSQQQLVGIDQIAIAMESIRQASDQNVSGTKQVETSVQNIHDLGQRLKVLVNRYILK